MPTDLGYVMSQYVVHGTKFEAPKHYKVLEPIGQGAYGVVCSAKDEAEGETVAIKKIEDAFGHLTFAKRTLRELRMLRHLRHENLIDVRHVFLPGVMSTFEDIYVVSELMETDLASILRSSQLLTDDHCKFFLYQIMRGLKYVHSAQVIHRDLKPRNLLVNANCDLKICDFGLARIQQCQNQLPMTEYVCTRWYRAPEVLCSWSNYTMAIDIWSVGCIFAEMLTREPLFPGHNTRHQLTLIIHVLGTPRQEDLDKTLNDKCRSFIEALQLTEAIPLEELFSHASPSALNFLRKTLLFDPDKRSTVKQALQHSYLEQLYCPEDEPTRAPLDSTDFEFEHRKINKKALREELFLESLRYDVDQRARYMEQQKQLDFAHDIRHYRLLEPGEEQYSSDEDCY
uniref:Mitogen-activated protein kinase n=1 Tax=Noctiluca scintillans TaxID=2966 RepID=A0A7S1AP63_NOCSC|mmetsp:Transcript_54149/g.144736  ORF Transcript_54149/g.144736 Transcript_54149/m.144736 type:complete len:398 (+) Transcript_54149:51-1244(+)